MRSAKPWLRWAFAACVVIYLGCLIGVAGVANAHWRPSFIAIGLGLGFVPYAAVLWLAYAVPAPAAKRVAMACVLLVGGAFVFAPPILSDDLYRYLWEGRVWASGFNPYLIAPADPSLAPLRDALSANINHPHLTSAYPPLAQALFVVMHMFGGQVWLPKLVALFAHLLAIMVVARLCPTKPRRTMALALNPLLLSEGALQGHFDLLVGLALLLTAWGLARDRVVAAVVGVCSAIGLKLVGLVALPLFVRRPGALAVTVLASAVLFAPLLQPWAFAHQLSGSAEYLTAWRGNESLFVVVEWLARSILEAVSLSATPPSTGLLARVLAFALVLAVGLLAIRRPPSSPWAGMRAVLWATLLLSPQVHPWYLLWLVPIDVVAGGVAALVWSAAVLLSYASLDRWVTEQVWYASPQLQLLQYLCVACALLWEWRRTRFQGLL